MGKAGPHFVARQSKWRTARVPGKGKPALWGGGPCAWLQFAWGRFASQTSRGPCQRRAGTPERDRSARGAVKESLGSSPCAFQNVAFRGMHLLFVSFDLIVTWRGPFSLSRLPTQYLGHPQTIKTSQSPSRYFPVFW